jgi:hypothetical protein
MMEKNFYVITIELLIILSESRKGWPCVCRNKHADISTRVDGTTSGRADDPERFRHGNHIVRFLSTKAASDHHAI